MSDILSRIAPNCLGRENKIATQMVEAYNRIVGSNCVRSAALKEKLREALLNVQIQCTTDPPIPIVYVSDEVAAYARAADDKIYLSPDFDTLNMLDDGATVLLHESTHLTQSPDWSREQDEQQAYSCQLACFSDRIGLDTKAGAQTYKASPQLCK